jgi:serine/threonine-protein kinase
MSLIPGTKLGPYEIQSPLGAGGMGEVYRARDTRLDRTVAIKILPEQLSKDPVRKQRFEREAKTISSLNHPNICTLHDIGFQDGVDYLVMECVEGETLAKRLEKGPLPLEQVLKYGAQIADALDQAHRAAIVHRDLKPGNIMLTATGAKLLDFGLAKPTAPLMSGATLTATVTTPVTQEGTIVGTFQYMSPEQVEGKELDGRSDIFSLGAVLYEMLTGQRAFQGKSRLSVASAILEKEPAPISSIKPLTPPALDHAIRCCLAKYPEERWQAARDLSLELKWIAESGSPAEVAGASITQRRLGERLAWLGVTAALAVTAIALGVGFFRRAPEPLESVHLTAEIGADVDLVTAAYGSVVALSPDGTHLAFAAQGADHSSRMYIRSLSQPRATVLAGTQGARHPFFSPDGQWIGFFAEGKLKKIAKDGGAAVTVCDAPRDSGGSWSEDGTIVFTASPSGNALLFKVPSEGGSPEPLALLDKQPGKEIQAWPQIMPNGKGVLYTSRTLSPDFDSADLVVYSPASGQRKTLIRGGFYGRYSPSGHLLYIHEGNLFAVPFNLNRLEVTGGPQPIVEEVASNNVLSGGAQFSISEGGTLAYISGHGETPKVAIYWMDRDGKFQPLRETLAGYRQPAFSPDGRRLAVEIQEGRKSDLWVYDLGRDTFTRLVADAGSPAWTPDGQRIAYQSVAEKNGEPNLYWKRADGTGDAQRLTNSKDYQFPFSWRPDGRTLAFTEFSSSGGTNWDVMTLSLEGDEKTGWKPNEPKPFANTPFNEAYPDFSPDGRWLAYGSSESGIYEVYVRPFPGPGGRWQISSGGGWFPKWSKNGKELFYRTTFNLTRGPDCRIMVVTYTVFRESFHADKPRLWSPGQFTDLGVFANFDLHPDGKRFAVLKAPGAEGQFVANNKVNFIFNFFEVLRRKFPKEGK